MAPEVHRCQVNGVDFAYLEDGPPDGPLALCLHGFPDHTPTSPARGTSSTWSGPRS